MAAVGGWAPAGQVRGDPPSDAEDLDAESGRPHVDPGSDQLVGHGVVMAVGLDVVVDVDLDAEGPGRELVGAAGPWPGDRALRRASAVSRRASRTAAR